MGLFVYRLRKFSRIIKENKMRRKTALAKFLDVKQSEISVSENSKLEFNYGNQTYLVLTDRQANLRAKEYILDMIWTFKTSFLSNYIPLEIGDIEHIQEKCESSNNTFLTLLGNKKNKFVADAIGSNGRGHFISQYDGHENYDHNSKYYIYRTN